MPAVEADDASSIVRRDTVLWKVLERGTIETFAVVADRVFADELHLRFCAGSF